LRKNWMTTLGGVLAGLGTLPLLVTASHVAFPLWWNDVQFPLFLCGAAGTIIMGLAAKGQDEHSTPAQMQAAADQAAVKQAVADADAAAKPAVPAKVIVEQTPKTPGE
jgi:hypothetical protein